jgi:hypothetical protein
MLVHMIENGPNNRNALLEIVIFFSFMINDVQFLLP